jgi:hypothetical protein
MLKLQKQFLLKLFQTAKTLRDLLKLLKTALKLNDKMLKPKFVKIKTAKTYSKLLKLKIFL